MLDSHVFYFAKSDAYLIIKALNYFRNFGLTKKEETEHAMCLIRDIELKLPSTTGKEGK